MTPNNTLQGTRSSGRHEFRHRAVRALERGRYVAVADARRLWQDSGNLEA